MKEDKKILIATKLFLENDGTTGSEKYFATILNELKKNYTTVDYLCLEDVSSKKRKIAHKNSPQFIFKAKGENIFLRKWINILSLLLRLKYKNRSQKRIKHILLRKVLKIKTQYFETKLNDEQLSFAKNILKKKKYDVIIANYTNLCNLFDLKEAKTSLKFVLTNDIWHIRRKLFKEQGLNYKNIYYWIKENEKAFLSKADVIVSIQKEETQKFQDLCKDKKIITTPMSFKQIVKHNEKPTNDTKNIICVGGCSEVNQQGIEFFIENVFNDVLKVHPNTVLNVYGDVCILFKKEYKNVKFHGRVESLKDAYLDSNVAIVPLLAGTGLKIKFVEALAHAVPIVATTFGIEGCADAKDFCAFLADEPSEFAKRVNMLLDDKELRLKMGANCEQYLKKYFSPEVTMKELLKTIEDYYEQ